MVIRFCCYFSLLSRHTATKIPFMYSKELSGPNFPIHVSVSAVYIHSQHRSDYSATGK
jgi:hypothetical protein